MENMQKKVETQRIQNAMGSLLMEQFMKKKASEYKRSQGLSKISKLIAEAVNENYISELQVILYDKPVLFDEDGSTEAA